MRVGLRGGGSIEGFMDHHFMKRSAEVELVVVTPQSSTGLPSVSNRKTKQGSTQSKDRALGSGVLKLSYFLGTTLPS